MVVYQLSKYLIAAIWLINGLVCKVMNVVPRHQLIVAAILGRDHAAVLTTLIGVAEIGMALWIVSGIKPRLNALVQVAIIGTMNLLEFTLVPELLLWGRFNLLFAMLLIGFILCNEFYWRPKPSKTP